VFPLAVVVVVDPEAAADPDPDPPHAATRSDEATSNAPTQRVREFMGASSPSNL
jgi:hypothetical protein